MLWKKTGKRHPKTSDLTAFIDEGSEIEGKYTFSGTVMVNGRDRKSTRLNSSHIQKSRMPSSA